MVAEWREGVALRRGAMHERDWPEGRLADGADVECEGEFGAYRLLKQRGELHEEIVWMLAVDERSTFVGLASLEQEWIAASAERRRFEAGHGVQMQQTSADATHRHRHFPVNDADLL